MTPDRLKQKQHFYFCVLVALKIAGRDKPIASAVQKNLFLLRWLQNARARFGHDARTEIAWLHQRILCAGLNADPEPMLERIYRTAFALSPVLL